MSTRELERLQRLIDLGDADAARRLLEIAPRRHDGDATRRARQVIEDRYRNVAVVAAHPDLARHLAQRLTQRHPDVTTLAEHPPLLGARIAGNTFHLILIEEPACLDLLGAALLAADGVLLLLHAEDGVLTPRSRALLDLHADWDLPVLIGSPLDPVGFLRTEPAGCRTNAAEENDAGDVGGVVEAVRQRPALARQSSGDGSTNRRDLEPPSPDDISDLLSSILRELPPPRQTERLGVDPFTLPPEPILPDGDHDEPFSAVVAGRVTLDNGLHRSVVRILSGTLQHDLELLNAAQLYHSTHGPYGSYLRRPEAAGPVGLLPFEEAATPGRFAVLRGARADRAGETLCGTEHPIRFPHPIPLQHHCFATILAPSGEAVYELFARLEALPELLPALRVKPIYHAWEERARLGEFIAFELRSPHPAHLRVALSHLERPSTRSPLDVSPIQPLRYARLRGSVDQRNRFVTDSQFGAVTLRFETDRDAAPLNFIVETDAIPQEFIPAIEMGLRASLLDGAGLDQPISGLRATLIDGQFHIVDSSFRAYWIAAQRALEQAVQRLPHDPLEPWARVERPDGPHATLPLQRALDLQRDDPRVALSRVHLRRA